MSGVAFRPLPKTGVDLPHPRPRLTAAIGCCLLLAGVSTHAEAQQGASLPAAVLDHVQQLDQRCGAVGGRPSGGRFIIAQDFTGDGRTDFLLSEGDYACAGRPDMFRRNGQARVAIYVTDASNAARRVYLETLAAYRVLAGEPARVQVARRGTACGPGTAPNGLCGGTLEWNGRALALATPASANAPAANTGTNAAPVASGSTATGAGTALPKSAAPVVADGQASNDSIADLLLSVIPEQPGARPSLEATRQAATGVRWGAKAAPRSLASGTFGGLPVSVNGRGQPETVVVSWTKPGALIPFDIPAAMRQRGVTLTQVSCEKIGVGEGQRVYEAAAAGRAPFALTIEQRTAPTASASSYYGAIVSLDGRRPPRGPGADCDF